jgi:hypothetical protein
MRLAGEMESLRAEFAQELSAAGVPESAQIVYIPEPPLAMRAVVTTASDAWFAVKSAGNPAVVKRAENENEKGAVRRAAADAAVQPPEQRDSSPDARATTVAHPGSTGEATPDDPSNDKNNPWHLEVGDGPVPEVPTKKKPDANATLKALNARLERMVPKIVGVDPIEKSFLLSEGYDPDDVDRGEIRMTPALRRDYVRWLAKETRATSYRLLTGGR